MTPYPSSVIYDMAKRGERLRLLTENWSEYKRYGNCVIETEKLSREDIIGVQKLAHREFWTQPRVILNHINRLVRGDGDKKFYNRPLIEALASLGNIKIEELDQESD